MTYEQAKIHLKDCITDDGLYSLSWYLSFTNGSANANLDGAFDAEDLEAIACYMRHNRVRQIVLK